MCDIVLSVIIPVFNRENTITTCVEGILNTEFKRFEVLIIDDGSSDETLHLCRQLEHKHSQVKVFSIPNSGVSVARNEGIKKAAGKYILFVDSDDTLCPNALMYISKHLISNIDLLMFSHISIKSEEVFFDQQQKEIFSLPVELEGNKEIVRWLFTEYVSNHDDYYTVWNKAFKSDIIKKNCIYFPADVSLGEDQIFICNYLEYVHSLTHTYNIYKYDIVWSKEMRPMGLGSILRSPENFLYNQKKNYEALIKLYEHTNVSEVKQYAVNYILDRPVTRIIHRHLNLLNKNTISVFHLMRFTSQEIRPIIINLQAYISKQKEPTLKLTLRLIASGKICFAMLISYIHVNKSIVLKLLKKIKFYLSK